MKIGKGYGLAVLIFGSIWLVFHIIEPNLLVVIDGMIMALGGHMIDNLGDETLGNSKRNE